MAWKVLINNDGSSWVDIWLKSRSNQNVIYFSCVFTLYPISVISGHTSVTFLSQYLCGCDFSSNNHVSFILSHTRHSDINPLTNIQQILDLQHPSYLLGNSVTNESTCLWKRLASRFFVHASALFSLLRTNSTFTVPSSISCRTK